MVSLPDCTLKVRMSSHSPGLLNISCHNSCCPMLKALTGGCKGKHDMTIADFFDRMTYRSCQGILQTQLWQLDQLCVRALHAIKSLKILDGTMTVPVWGMDQLLSIDVISVLRSMRMHVTSSAPTNACCCENSCGLALWVIKKAESLHYQGPSTCSCFGWGLSDLKPPSGGCSVVLRFVNLTQKTAVSTLRWAASYRAVKEGADKLP